MLRRYVLQAFRFNLAKNDFVWTTDKEFGVTTMTEEQVDHINLKLQHIDYRFALQEEEGK